MLICNKAQSVLHKTSCIAHVLFRLRLCHMFTFEEVTPLRISGTFYVKARGQQEGDCTWFTYWTFYMMSYTL